MLQNRIDPHGNFIKTNARGNWMGNRGQLHNTGKSILRPFKLKAWLICLLEFKGRRRQVMAPNLYTELFFLDEATALAAGHRPCFECRREDAGRFKLAWIKGNPKYGFDSKIAINKIDKVIHEQRINKDGIKMTFRALLKDLPSGVFFEMNGQPYLLANGHRYLWSPDGYGNGYRLNRNELVKVLTPRSVVNAIQAGYRPQMAIDNSNA
jgi:hypothetical protein